MGNVQPTAPVTLQDYLLYENAQPTRNELINGAVIAMPDTRRIEGVVVGNLLGELWGQLRRSPCRAFAVSAKLQVDEANVLYPDVFVTCDPGDLATDQIFTAPTFIAEILSPSTEAYDRGLKFTRYRQLMSLREYLLVDPDTREVQLFRRGADGLFTLHDLSGAAVVSLESIGCSVRAEDLFDGLEGPAPEVPEA